MPSIFTVTVLEFTKKQQQQKKLLLHSMFCLLVEFSGTFHEWQVSRQIRDA